MEFKSSYRIRIEDSLMIKMLKFCQTHFPKNLEQLYRQIQISREERAQENIGYLVKSILDLINKSIHL